MRVTVVRDHHVLNHHKSAGGRANLEAKRVVGDEEVVFL